MAEQGRTCGIFRLTTVYNSTAGHAVYGWCCVYIGVQAAWRQGSTVYRRGKKARYTNATMGILVYDIQTQYTTAITRASQRPAACIACVRACVRVILLYYYNIIILLYLYIPNISSIPSIHNIPNIPNNGNIAL